MAIDFKPLDTTKTAIQFKPLAESAVKPKISASKNPFSKNAPFSITNALTGISKSYASAVDETAQLGQKTLGKLLPKSIRQEIATLPKSVTTPTEAEKPGFFGGQVSQFLAPGEAGIKAAKGASLLTKIGTGALEAGLVGTAQSGSVTEGVKTAAVGGVLPVLGKLASPIVKQVTQRLPKRIIQSVVGQSKAERLAGKDISEYVLKTKKVGTADKLIRDSSEAVVNLSKQIQHNLENVAPKTARLLKNEILGKTAVQINKNGGATTASEVYGVLQQLAPQIKSLLQRQSLSLPEANKLRQALDQTLGDRGFLVSQLPYNTAVFP